MAITSLLVANLTTTAPYAASFVVEVYSDSGLTTLVGSDSCPAVSSGTSFVQASALVVHGLTYGATYYARAGVVAPVTGLTTWSGTDTIVMGSHTAPTGVTYSSTTLTATGSGINVTTTPGSIPTNLLNYEAIWRIDGSTPAATDTPTWTGVADGAGHIIFFAGGSPGNAVHVYIRTVNTAGQRQSWTSLGTATVLTGVTSGTTAGGDLSGTYPNPTVTKLNGTSLAGLATGLLKNTTGTGVPSIATASDIPNIAESQVTNLVTDLAAKVPTTRTVNGHALSSNVTVTVGDLAIVSTAGITVDGGGSTLTTGSKGFVQVRFPGTITAWTLIGDVSGSVSITVKKATFAAFPTTTSIVASAPPTLSSQQNATSTTLTGWTTTITAGDVLEFVIASVSTLTRFTLELEITRS